MVTKPMTIDIKRLISALGNEWESLCLEEYDEDDQDPEEYRADLLKMSMDELLPLVLLDDDQTMDEYLDRWADDV